MVSPTMEVEVLPDTNKWVESIFSSDVGFSRADMNHLIYNYLVTEGYKDAAVAFEKEASVTHDPVISSSLESRLMIRESIEDGRINDAIELINDHYPDLLDDEPHLHFKIQQQNLIELIRGGNVDEALDFASTQLAQRGEEESSILNELERSMALLAYDHPEKSPFAALLNNSHRQQVASDINTAILKAECAESTPHLTCIVKMLIWTQDVLNSRNNGKFPKMTDIASGQIQ